MEIDYSTENYKRDEYLIVLFHHDSEEQPDTYGTYLGTYVSTIYDSETDKTVIWISNVRVLSHLDLKKEINYNPDIDCDDHNLKIMLFFSNPQDYAASIPVSEIVKIIRLDNVIKSLLEDGEIDLPFVFPASKTDNPEEVLQEEKDNKLQLVHMIRGTLN